MSAPDDAGRPWTACADRLPPEGWLVETKIDDAQGSRNEQPLMRRGRLWYVEGETMYVYCTPTHWRL